MVVLYINYIALSRGLPLPKFRIIYNNLWRGGSIISQSSQNPQFPAIDTQIDTKEMYWRSLAIEKLTDGGLNLWESATDLTHWTESISGTSTVNREATEKIEGDYSCRLDVDASNSSVYFYQLDISIIPLKKNKLIVWYKNSIAGKTAKIEFKNTGGNVWLKEDGTWNAGTYYIVLSNSTVWKKFELEFYAHSDYSSYLLRLRSNSTASSSIYLDKVSLVECPSISCDIGEFSPAGKGLMNFDSGDIEPIVGEWLFGELASGKVVSVTKDSGAWGSNTAVGSIVLEKCEGCFNDNEDIRGSIGGTNMLTVNQPDGAVGVDKLVKNGAFVATVDDWTPTNCTLASIAGGKVGNCLEITRTGGDSQYALQALTLTVGKLHKLVGYVKSGTSGDENWNVSISGMVDEGGTSSAAWVKFSIVFEATSASPNLALWKNSATAGTMLFDEVSIYELDEDDTEKKVDFIAILGHNFSQTAEIKAIGSMESDFSDTVEEVVIPYNEGDISYFFPSAVTRRYWKVEVTDPDNPDGHVQAATIILGKYFEPEWSYIKPHSEGKDIASELEFTDSMVLYAHKKPTRKTWLLNFRLTEAEKDKVLELIEENENHEAFIACFDSDNPNLKSCLVKLRAVEEPEYISYDRWRWEAPVIEVL